MHIEVFVHSDKAGVRASVQAWSTGPGGIVHWHLLDREPLDVPLGTEDAVELLRSLYRAVGAALPLRQPPEA